MPTSRKTLAGAFTGLFAMGYIGICGWMWQHQHHFIFHPPGTPTDVLDKAAARHGAQPFELPIDDDTLYGWHYPGEGQRAVLYFHGNGGSAAAGGRYHTYLSQNGWDVYTVSMRGYPGSTGVPSEQHWREDAVAVWEHVTEVIDPDKVVIHGHSLGGGTAGLLMEEITPGGWILESTFTSLPDIAKQRFPWAPVDLLLESKFDTISHASRVQAPMLIAHGTMDEVVAPSHAQALAAAFPTAELLIAHDAGHNDDLLITRSELKGPWLAFLEQATN